MLFLYNRVKGDFVPEWKEKTRAKGLVRVYRGLM